MSGYSRRCRHCGEMEENHCDFDPVEIECECEDAGRPDSCGHFKSFQTDPTTCFYCGHRKECHK